MDMLGPLKKLREPNPLETLIYHADPLLIVHPDDGIVFYGRMDFEFTPVRKDGKKGRAVCSNPVKGERVPALNVHDAIEFQPLEYRGYNFRSGITFVGEDDEGEPFTWYLDKMADDYILSLRDAQPPEELPSEEEVS